MKGLQISSIVMSVVSLILWVSTIMGIIGLAKALANYDYTYGYYEHEWIVFSINVSIYTAFWIAKLTIGILILTKSNQFNGKGLTISSGIMMIIPFAGPLDLATIVVSSISLKKIQQ